MGMIKLDYPHTLSVDDAKARITALLSQWSSKYGVKISWAGEKATFNGKVMGISFDGHLSVNDQRVGGEATDPGMLLRGQATKYLHRKFNEFLDPKKSLGELQQAT